MGLRLLLPAARHVRGGVLAGAQRTARTGARQARDQAFVLHNAGARNLLWLRTEIDLCPRLSSEAVERASARVLSLFELRSGPHHDGGGHFQAGTRKLAGVEGRPGDTRGVLASRDAAREDVDRRCG